MLLNAKIFAVNLVLQILISMTLFVISIVSDPVLVSVRNGQQKRQEDFSY